MPLSTWTISNESQPEANASKAVLTGHVTPLEELVMGAKNRAALRVSIRACKVSERILTYFHAFAHESFIHGVARLVCFNVVRV